MVSNPNIIFRSFENFVIDFVFNNCTRFGHALDGARGEHFRYIFTLTPKMINFKAPWLNTSAFTVVLYVNFSGVHCGLCGKAPVLVEIWSLNMFFREKKSVMQHMQ